MLRKRLASLALAAGLGLTSGCLGFGNPCCAPPVCCPASPCCGSSVSGYGAGAVVSGYGGGVVEAAPCCNSHATPPPGLEGPVMGPQEVLPPGNGTAPLVMDRGMLSPAPDLRLVPSPQAPTTPYVPGH